MYTICCTSKVLKRTKLPVETVLPAATNALGNWHVHLMYFGRLQMLLFVNDTTRIAVATPAQNTRDMAAILTMYLRDVLMTLGAKPAWIEAELLTMADVRYAASQSRSVLASITQIKFSIYSFFEQHGEYISQDLNVFLCSLLSSSLDYKNPGKYALELLQSRYGAI